MWFDSVHNERTTPCCFEKSGFEVLHRNLAIHSAIVGQVIAIENTASRCFISNLIFELGLGIACTDLRTRVMVSMPSTVEKIHELQTVRYVVNSIKS